MKGNDTTVDCSLVRSIAVLSKATDKLCYALSTDGIEKALMVAKARKLIEFEYQQRLAPTRYPIKDDYDDTVLKDMVKDCNDASPLMHQPAITQRYPLNPTLNMDEILTTRAKQVEYEKGYADAVNNHGVTSYDRGYAEALEHMRDNKQDNNVEAYDRGYADCKSANVVALGDAFAKGYEKCKIDNALTLKLMQAELKQVQKTDYDAGYVQCKLDNKQRHIDQGYQQALSDMRASKAGGYEFDDGSYDRGYEAGLHANDGSA